MHRQQPKRPIVRLFCLCGMELEGRMSAGQLLYQHLGASGRCRDLYVAAGKIQLTDDPRRILIITPSIHVNRIQSKGWEVVGMGVCGDRFTLGIYSQRRWAEREAGVLRGEKRDGGLNHD